MGIASMARPEVAEMLGKEVSLYQLSRLDGLGLILVKPKDWVYSLIKWH